MVKKIGLSGVLVLSLILAACAPSSPTPTSTDQPTATPEATLEPPTPTPEPVEPPSTEPTEATMAAREALSASLDLPIEEIEIISHERRDWPDACLGLAREGEACAQVIVPGWRVVLRAQGEQHVFRTDESGEVVRPEEPEGMLGGGEPEILAQGEFEGVAGHEGTGTVTITPLPDGGALLRFEEFSVTQGPDLYIYLVGAPDPATSDDFGEFVDLGLLESNVGAQEYVIPADVDVSQYQSVIIYCLAYDVLFARATVT